MLICRKREIKIMVTKNTNNKMINNSLQQDIHNRLCLDWVDILLIPFIVDSFYYGLTDASFTMSAFGKSPQCITWRFKYTTWPQQHLDSGALCWGLISTMRPAIFFAEEVMVKPTALNSPPPLLRWFYQQIKNHTIHCIGVYNITVFTDSCAVLSERERVQK